MRVLYRVVEAAALLHEPLHGYAQKKEKRKEKKRKKKGCVLR
jgi:hypothetical protein